MGAAQRVGMDFSFLEASTLLAGLLCVLAGSIVWTVAAFRTGPWWGLGCFFFLVPVGFVFAARHWRRARWGVAWTAVGMLLMVPAAGKVWRQWPELMEAARGMQAELILGL